MIELTLPAGTLGGQIITLTEKGHKKTGYSAADLNVEIKEVPHPLFKRLPNKPRDLQYTVKISPKDKWLKNFKLQIPSLDGEMILIEKPIFEDKVKFENRGLPYPRGTGKRGDLYVYFETKNGIVCVIIRRIIF